MADTRKDRRAPISLKVRFKSATVDEFIEQYAKDISRGGIFIKSKKPMAVGTLLKFEFQLKDESRLIHGVGRVVWKREDDEASGEQAPPGMGIKFIKMDPQSRAMVEKIVESRGSDVGTFEGHVAAAPTVPPKAGAAPFFPSTTPQDQLPKPEDRTQVRHASEFLASALSEADDESAKEAAARAEEARQRTEEIQQERDAEEARRIAEEEAAARHEPLLPELDAIESLSPQAEAHAPLDPLSLGDEATGYGDPPGLDADGAASEAAFAAMDAALEQAAREAEGVGEALRSEAVDPLAATIAAPTSDGPPAKDTSSFEDALVSDARDSSSSFAPAVAPGPTLPIDDDVRVVEPKRSVALPIGIAVAAAVGIGLIAWPLFNKQGAAETIDASNPAPESGLAATDPVPEEPVPAPVEQVDLHVVSNPEGAAISIDGESAGESPSVIQIPLGQEVTVAVHRTGFQEASQTVTGGPDMDPSIAFELEPMEYVVLVETTPPGARVRGIGRPALAPAELMLRGPASRSITLTASRLRYRQASTTVDVDDFLEEDGRMVARVHVQLVSAGRPPRPRPAVAPTAPEAPLETEPETAPDPATTPVGDPPPDPAAAETEAPASDVPPPPEAAAPEPTVEPEPTPPAPPPQETPPAPPTEAADPG